MDESVPERSLGRRKICALDRKIVEGKKYALPFNGDYTAVV